MALTPVELELPGSGKVSMLVSDRGESDMMVAGDVGCAVWEAPWEELAGRWAGRGGG